MSSNEQSGKTAANDDNFDANTQRREAAEDALRYTPPEIEPRWQQRWDADPGLYAAVTLRMRLFMPSAM